RTRARRSLHSIWCTGWRPVSSRPLLPVGAHAMRDAVGFLIGVAAIAATVGGCSERTKSPPQALGQRATPVPMPLITGKSIEPRPSASADVGSIPFNMVLSPDGRFAVTTDNGFRQELHAIRTDDGVSASHVEFGKSTTNPKYGLYYGLAFAPDG